MKFVLDAQLPPALAVFLREHGHEAVTVREAGLRDAEDPAIWEFALAETAAILTKDEDFAVRARLAAVGPPVVWLRVGNCSNRALRLWLGPRLEGIVQLVGQGGRLVEVI